jgi:hypothetical protein
VKRWKPGDWVRITRHHDGPEQYHIGKIVKNPITARYPESPRVKIALKCDFWGGPVDYKQTGGFALVQPAHLETISDLELLVVASRE